MVERTSHLLVEGNRLGDWGGPRVGVGNRPGCVLGSGSAVLHFWLRRGGDRSADVVDVLPGVWLEPVLCQGRSQKQRVPLKASAVIAIASSRRGQTGLGGVLVAAAVAVARCVLWPQFLSLVSEEALPNKMSLSWDMPLSCDLVLMRNWALRNISLSCSCLSSR